MGWGGGGTHRSLVAGEGWGLVGCFKEGQVQGRVGSFYRRGQGGIRAGSGRVCLVLFEGGGARARGGSKSFDSGGGVGGRGTGLRHGANPATRLGCRRGLGGA